jgi:septum formation protein
MTKTSSDPAIILASQSEIRRQMLERAGIAVTICPADIDEATIRTAISNDNEDLEPGDMATILAQAKAVSVSERNHGALVIGADQVLVCDGVRYDKPVDADAARDQLLTLRGKTHTLVSAVACARNGTVTWFHDQTAHLTMRSFSNGFLGSYMARVGADVTSSVGAYKLEGLGVQLFETVEGDYFTILGLPLLALLEFLRGEGALNG